MTIIFHSMHKITQQQKSGILYLQCVNASVKQISTWNRRTDGITPLKGFMYGKAGQIALNVTFITTSREMTVPPRTSIGKQT